MTEKLPPDAPTSESIPKKLVCGLIMPISPLDGCDETHWQEVREIICEATEIAGFEPQLVSDADDVGIIQKRIIQNLYDNPIVICDVSGKNPNVMFELGLRLAFDKPTIIVKDDKTSYSFDTAPIEHLEYPRDLRFAKIVAFKQELAEKIKGTQKKATEDKDYTTFLKHFGTFTIPKLNKQEVSRDAFILEELQRLGKLVTDSMSTRLTRPLRTGRKSICLRECSVKESDSIAMEISTIPGISSVTKEQIGKDHYHVIPRGVMSETRWPQMLKVAKTILPGARILEQ